MAKAIEVTGLNELRANLLRAAAKTRAAASEALAQEVAAVRADAIDEAPRDTGELEGGIKGNSVGTTGEVRATARHSVFVEHGTSKTPAQPYMAPAAERSRRRFVGRVTVAVKTALEGIRG